MIYSVGDEALAARREPAEAAIALPADLIFVGEHNPYGEHPEYAMYPVPAASSGGRLAVLLGLNPETIECSWRANLCPRGWLAAEALRRMRLLLAGPWGRYVLCGSRVRGALLKARDLAPATKSQAAVAAWTINGKRFLAIPHPSGRSRRWDDPGVRDATRARFLEMLR